VGFSGKIEDFSVVEIMQYIHASGKSGTLIFSRGGDEGRVYFRKGNIHRVALPGMTNIGEVLLERMRITPSQLQMAVRVQKASGGRKLLGRILEEMKAIDHAALREAVFRQAQEVIGRLVTWEEGDFGFELSSGESPDDIAVNLDDLIPLAEIDTEFILLEAMRIFDEGRHRETEARKPGAGSALTRELLSGPHAGRSPEISDDSPLLVSLLKQMLAEGRKNGQALSVNFLKVLKDYLDRAVLFLVRKDALLGVGAYGRTRDEKPLDAAVKNIEIPLEADCLPRSCIGGRIIFHGPPPGEEPWIRTLYGRIGAPRSPEVVILPLVGLERVIGLVYGDNGGEERPIKHLELMEVIAGVTGIIFENAFLRKQIKRNVQ